MPSAAERGALAAICDTFAPGSVELGVPAQVLELARLNPSVRERDLRALLTLFALTRFPRRRRERRESILRAWCDSRIPQRRAAFHALRKGVLLAYYSHAESQRRIGYPGALGPAIDAPPPRITPTRA